MSFGGLQRAVGVALLAVGVSLIFALIGFGSKGAYAQVANYTEAETYVNNECNAGRTMAHAGYGYNPRLNDDTGVVTYDFAVIWRKCYDSAPTSEYAVTGYANQACPSAGRYHNGGWDETYDCIKYSSRHTDTAVGDSRGIIGRDCASNPYQWSRCVYNGFNGSVLQGGRYGPGDTNMHARYIGNRTVQIDNWTERTKTSGSADVFVASICAYDGAGGANLSPCMNSIVRVSWTRPWAINAQTYIKKSAVGTENTNDGFSQPSTAITAGPGEYLYWKHDLRVIDGNINQNFSWTMRWTGFPADFVSNKGNQYIHEDYTPLRKDNGELFVKLGALPGYDPSNTIYQVRSGDAGNNLCQSIDWMPESWNSNANPSTPYKASYSTCAYIPYNFSLVPSVTSPADGTIVESDQDTITVTGQVANNGPTKSGTDVSWRITQINYAPSVTTIPNRAGGTGSDPCAYFTGEQSCNILTQGTESGGLAYPDTKSYSANNGQLANNPVGTKICFVLSVNRYDAANMGNANAWRHSALNCLIVGKKPKVQVWGGGVSAGKVFNGTALQSSSKVATSLTTKSAKAPTTQPAPAGAITGLWKTGVDDSGNKLAENQSDPHWEIDRVYRPAGNGSTTCQKGYNSAGSFADIPTTSGSHFQARTIRELSPNVNAGQFIVDSSNSVTGGDTTALPPSANGTPIWGRTSPGARWISQNFYGQNYSSTGCKDPTGPTSAHPGDINYANIYVFKLKQPIQVDSSVDLPSIRLTIRGAVDNLVKFYVNGCELQGTYGADANNWQNPGWSPTSVAGAQATVRGSCANPNGFRHGDNSLEIHVQSTYSHTGLLIDQVDIDATVSNPVSNVFGSWSEYGIYAPSTVNLMASSSGLSGGSTSNSQSTWSSLTFASRYTTTTPSACSTIRYGCYSPAKTTLPDPSSTFTYATAVEQSGSSWNLSTLMKGRNIKPTAATTTLNLTSGATTLGSGEWLVINAPNATVNITSNLTYTSGSLSRADQIPQLIIIAGRINIASNVTQVDAWLIAKNGSTLDGRINTCSTTNTGTDLPITQNLSSSLCDKPLRVNGPVVANMLYLRRTAGSGVDAQSGDPAEVFNLRPDAYIWARAKTEALGSLMTTYMVELPPRY